MKNIGISDIEDFVFYVYFVYAMAKSKHARAFVVSLRVTAQQNERLQRCARRLGRTPSETGAMLLEESLRRADFAFIDFRDSAVGRQAYVIGSRLAVWQVVWLVRAHDRDIDATAEDLGWPALKVRAAMNYAEAFAEEIETALADAGEVRDIRRMVPQLEELDVG